jgi:hypothetical protein
MRRAWGRDLRRLRRACVGDGDGHGEGLAREVRRLRGGDDDTESGVGDGILEHSTSEGRKRICSS